MVARMDVPGHHWFWGRQDQNTIVNNVLGDHSRGVPKSQYGVMLGHLLGALPSVPVPCDLKVSAVECSQSPSTMRCCGVC